MAAQSLHDWFQTPLGNYLLDRELAWLDSVVPDIFGFHAIQLGLPETDFLRGSRIVQRAIVDPSPLASVRAQLHELPFDSQSIDLCVIPHALEFGSDPQVTPHEILREVDRVMRPEGRILILGFNPWSLFGMKRLWTSEGYPWCGHFVSLVRMKDWLQLLGFEPSAGKLACYIPPCETGKWQARWHFAESYGERWWGVAGGVYMLEAIKRVNGMRLITPKWSDQRVRERRFAAVAKSDQIPASGERRTHHGVPLRLVK